MAQIRDYQVGVTETQTLIPIAQADGSLQFLSLDGVLKNAFYDLVLYTDASGTSQIPGGVGGGNYEYGEPDAGATAKEAGTGGTGETIYSQFKVTNATYQGIDLWATFTNIGTYTSNDALYGIANRLGEMSDFPFSVTGTTLTDLYSSYGKYAVFCNGATIDSADNPMYANLVSMLKAEAGGDTGHPYYAAGSTQAVLPDARGRVSRGLDTSGTIDPDGATRDLGGVQADAFQGHIDQFLAYSQTSSGSNDKIVYNGNSSITDTLPDPDNFIGYSSDGTNGTPRAASETRMANIAVNKIIFYV